MLKILIAEDDRELRQLFAHVLTKHGYTVSGVSDGQQALAWKLLKRSTPRQICSTRSRKCSPRNGSI